MSQRDSEIRWGVLGTANIAARAFLPALRAIGSRATIVGSRDPRSARAWAYDNHVERAGSYQDVVESNDVDAVYVALPNEMHVHWTRQALDAGKAVLCEKPLGLDAQQVETLLSTSDEHPMLWEGFVFPFHPQTERILTLVQNGDIGDVREVVSEFHFQVRSENNIRFQQVHGGGAMYDVGCYPLRLARLATGDEPLSAVAAAHFGDTGIDLDAGAIVHFPRDITLMLSAGLRRPPSTTTRIIGTSGELVMTNPFHPDRSDHMELWANGVSRQTWEAEPGTAFEYAVAHVNAVVRNEEVPRYRAVDDSRRQAAALDLVRSSMQGAVA